MPELSVFINRLENIEEFALKEGTKILVKEFKKDIEEYNRKQLEEGKNVDNRVIQRGYSEWHKRNRKERGLQTGFVDLKFTGDFYKSLDFKQIKDNEFGVFSDVEYFGNIVRLFGTQVMGLDEKSADAIAVKLSEKLSKKIETYLKK